jgi:hypothetical protein
LDEGEVLPHVGAQPKLGYMNMYELGDADDYVTRPALPDEPLAWTDNYSPVEWRGILLQRLTDPEGSQGTQGSG